MATNMWAQTCARIEKQYRKLRDESIGIQRVQVRTAIDRWTQDSLRPVADPVESWQQRSSQTMCLLELSLAEFVSPRLRHQLSTQLLEAVEEVAASQSTLVQKMPNVAVDVVAPSVLSLAAGIGVVRGVVFVMDYSGISVHGSWWVVAAIIVGLMFMGIVAMLRYRQHTERLHNTLLVGVRREMDRRVEELMAQWFYSGSPFDARRSDIETPPDCVWVQEGEALSALVPRRVALVLQTRPTPPAVSKKETVDTLVAPTAEAH